jgi:SAM-dependent methyltransferase
MEYRELTQARRVEKEHFYYLAKQYLIEKLLKKFCPKGLQILALGCGTGKEAKILSQFGQVTGLDGSKEAIKMCSKRNFEKLILYEIKDKLPFKNNSFDLVCAFDVLEHLQYDQLIIKEIRRILKRGGLFFFTVPAYQFLYSSHDRALQHQRRYNKKHILKLLNNDFIVIKISFFNALLFPLLAVYRLIKKLSKNTSQTDIALKIPPFINQLFLFILKKEADLICRFSLPFGLTLVGLVKKK